MKLFKVRRPIVMYTVNLKDMPKSIKDSPYLVYVKCRNYIPS